MMKQFSKQRNWPSKTKRKSKKNTKPSSIKKTKLQKYLPTTKSRSRTKKPAKYQLNSKRRQERTRNTRNRSRKKRIKQTKKMDLLPHQKWKRNRKLKIRSTCLLRSQASHNSHLHQLMMKTRSQCQSKILAEMQRELERRSKTRLSLLNSKRKMLRE